jgi:hypothetical protein
MRKKTQLLKPQTNEGRVSGRYDDPQNKFLKVRLHRAQEALKRVNMNSQKQTTSIDLNWELNIVHCWVQESS